MQGRITTGEQDGAGNARACRAVNLVKEHPGRHVRCAGGLAHHINFCRVTAVLRDVCGKPLHHGADIGGAGGPLVSGREAVGGIHADATVARKEGGHVVIDQSGQRAARAGHIAAAVEINHHRGTGGLLCRNENVQPVSRVVAIGDVLVNRDAVLGRAFLEWFENGVGGVQYFFVERLSHFSDGGSGCLCHGRGLRRNLRHVRVLLRIQYS